MAEAMINAKNPYKKTKTHIKMETESTHFPKSTLGGPTQSLGNW